MNFSVLMSLYYKEKSIYFDRCLDSIYNQSLKASEIILVIDGKIGNDLEEIIVKWKEKLPIKTVRLSENVGLGEALNIGLKNCTYNLIARMDTDDICMENRFERQVSEFKKKSNLVICGSSIIEVEPDTLSPISKRVVPCQREVILNELIWRNPFNHMTVMYKRDEIISVGSYKDLHYMEDWYLWLRLLRNRQECININEILVMARTGSSMISRRKGISYIKSEWTIFKHKISLGYPVFRSLLALLSRSAPRILPNKALNIAYLISRSVKKL
ncbi:glycosyltransferase [Vibrio parahaemolyticus]|nr:glycosyltransferase [Vibrio parahaemolyticus]MBM5034503.1 glycosyltransferase [Vibrio parahaemolyticus]MBM5047719.1 glycosyltransferase [Vibrio parahaemolyticus]MBM5076016.1 glycosyltransferase [Vibrio parahaemolyticus]